MSQDDYDLTEHDRVMSRELGARFARGRKRLDAWLTQASERIAAAHEMEVGAQRRLLNRLLDVKAEIVSAANLEPDNWHISRDLTPWKEARAKLIALAKGLGSATEILKADNPVVLDALLKASGASN